MTRTVDVVDTTAPVITLVGADPQVIEVGSPYVELGATALDNYDGDITGSILIDATAVNTSVVGSYTVTYNVTDSEGNAAVQVTRTVDIVDTTAPVITLVGANPQTIEVGSPYVELGATALDNYDGDLTGSIVIDATAVNTAVVGSYVVTYDVTDSNGNAATTVIRTVDVVDTTAPVITLVGPDPQVIEVGSPYVELGATALDNYDGDITGSILIDATSVNTSVVGSYTVTYNVTDSEGNPAIQVTRTVDVVDTTAPVITLVGANPQTIEVGSPYVELGATALDNYDGDLTGSIVIDATSVNTSVVGSYTVTYNVTDSEGNPAIQVTRTVDVVDTAAPVISLMGSNPQVIEAGGSYVESGATAFDSYDGDITGSIVIDATAVNTGVVGSYLVTYDVTDSSGNPASTVTRTVNVVDTTPPVITLVGTNPQNVEIGTSYIELGATATDSVDGDLTAAVVIDASAVDTSTTGLYPVYYNVTDAAGNAAAQLSRLVVVVDTNETPQILPIQDWAIAELATLTFGISATDPENQILIYNILSGPIGATIDPLSGAFEWTPSEVQGPGTFDITVSVADSGSPSLTAYETFTVIVSETNVAPTITGVADQNGSEGDTVLMLISAYDADLPENDLFFSATGMPAGVSIDAKTGRITGQIEEGAAEASPYAVTIGVRDNGLPSKQSTTSFTWTVIETPNIAPNALDDIYTLSGTMALEIPAPGLLGNDTDADGDPLEARLLTPPSQGTLTLEQDGSFVFEPANSTDTVTFRYEAADGRGGVASALVTVVLVENSPPVAANDSYLLTSLATIELDVLANDRDPDRDDLRLSAINAGNLAGTVALSGDSAVVYNPRSDFVGVERFSYVVVDGMGNSATAVVTVEIPEFVITEASEQSEGFGSGEAIFAAPEPPQLAETINLGFQVTLMADAFFQSVGALSLPLAFLMLALAIMFVWGRSMNIPLWLGGSRRRFWSVVLVGRERTLEVYDKADPESEVLYRFAPTAAGIVSTGKVQEGFLPVEAPRGVGWVDHSLMTPTVDIDFFMNDPRPVQLINELAGALESGGDLLHLISPRGLLFSIADKPIHLTADRLLPRHQPVRLAMPEMRGRSAVAGLQRDVFEALRQALLDLATISQDMAHSRNALIPSELWNFPYLAIHSPGHEPWLIHFEYRGRKPYIIGISLDK